jgi:hypothetical protein
MPKRHMRKPSLDAASAVFAVAVFAIACIVGVYFLIDLALKAVD